jgi:hypothetical protein
VSRLLFFMMVSASGFYERGLASRGAASLAPATAGSAPRDGSRRTQFTPGTAPTAAPPHRYPSRETESS